MDETVERLIYMTNFLCDVADGDESKKFYVERARELLNRLDLKYAHRHSQRRDFARLKDFIAARDAK